MSIRDWLVSKLLGATLESRVQEAVKVIDDRYWRNISQSNLERPWWEIKTELEDIHKAYQSNPLASRLVKMSTDFVIGTGAELTASAWVHSVWDHPLNKFDTRIYRWSNELALSGELFIVLSTNATDKMTYVREISAQMIDEIETDPEDLEHELRYHQTTDDPNGVWWPAAAPGSTEAQQVLHYSINKPIGATRGTSDLAQILPWLDRYDMWLEDRVRINRYKGAYLWHVTLQGAQTGQLEAKRAQYSRPPSSGSIIVSDQFETWAAIQPSIGADDVEADGKAIRLMIAAGAGVPLHFLAEGESATRATAREMGTATFRHFAHRQRIFSLLIEDVLGWIVLLAGRPKEDISVEFEEIMQEDERAQAPRKADQTQSESARPGE